MKKNHLLILALILIGMLQSCKKTKTTETIGKYEEGIFVVNEGNFTQGNASLSFIDKDLAGIENNVFYKVNQAHLGDQAQSVAFVNDKVYIVVTGSNKIEVADGEDLKKKATIASQLINPRYAQEITGNRAIVSCWGDTGSSTDDYLAVVDATSDVVIDKIPVELGPEKLDYIENYLFVAHQGAYGTNHVVSVLDLTSMSITKTIGVGDRPNSMVHNDDYLWVLSGGEPSWTGNETGGKLTVVDLTDLSVVQSFDFPVTSHPAHLSKDDDKLYYNIGKKVYKMNLSDSTLPGSPEFEYDGIGIYNMEANDGLLYITDAKDYQQEGDVIVYDLSNNTKKKTFTAGIIPGDLGFKD